MPATWCQVQESSRRGPSQLTNAHDISIEFEPDAATFNMDEYPTLSMRVGSHTLSRTELSFVNTVHSKVGTCD